jgi:hypothetical protein
LGVPSFRDRQSVLQLEGFIGQNLRKVSEIGREERKELEAEKAEARKNENLFASGLSFSWVG